MNVNKIQGSKIITFRPKTIEKATPKLEVQSPLQHDFHEKAPNNPQYYQVINNINFENHFIAMPSIKKDGKIASIRFHMPFQDGDSVTLDIDSSINLFLNPDGSINKESVDFFADRYISFYKIRKEKYENEKAMLLEVLNDNTIRNISVINPEKELEYALTKNIETEPESYAQSLLADILDVETKKTFAAMYLNKIEREFKESSLVIAYEVLNIMKIIRSLGRQVNNEELEKITSISVLSTQYSAIMKKDCLDYICELSCDENGKMNLDLCLLALKLLQVGAGCENSQEDISKSFGIVEKCKNKNPYDIDATIDKIAKQLEEGRLSLKDF